MSDLDVLAKRYQTALGDYLAGGEEPALQQAYDLGRQALGSGLGILDLATVHGEALVQAVQRARDPQDASQVVKRATGFFIESMSPFEMVDRGFREANAALRRVNETLKEQTAELESANNELAQDAKQYATLMATTPDGFWRFDVNGKLLEVNDVYCSMSGYARDELLQMHISDLEAIEKADETAAHIHRVMESGFDRFETQHRTKDGALLDVEVSVSFWQDTGRFLMFARDVSKRKQAEQALKESETKFRLVAETIEDVFWISTPGVTRMLYISPAYEKLWGQTVASLYQEPQSFLAKLVPDDVATLANVMQQYHARGKAYQCEYRLMQPDGSVRWILERGFPVCDESGNVKYMTGTCTDITEHKRTQEAIQRMNEELERRVRERTAQLEAANKELEAFAYSVSHDLRAPLRAIDGFSKILMDECASELSEEANRYLQLVRGNTQEMMTLIESLLTFSRSGRQPLAKQTVQPADLVRAAVDQVLTEKGDRQIEVTIGELPACQADPNLLKQVWVNLLSNAVKFTRGCDVARIEVGCKKWSAESGNKEIALTTDHQPQSSDLVYYVKDNGVGFDMQQSGKLFGVFQRLHASGDFEGNGVGLAIVARIIHRHGGDIWAESEVDKGATFYFAL